MGILDDGFDPEFLNSPSTPMLERIHIENFKCLRDVTVDLGDFTILIGPNDSGKSSFLEVIQTLGNIVRHGNTNIFQGDRSLANLVWRKDVGRHIVLEAVGTTPGHRFVYRVGLPVGQKRLQESLEWDGKKLFWTEEVGPDQAQSRTNFAPGSIVLAIATDKGKQLRPANVDTFYLKEFAQQRQADGLDLVEAFASSLEYQFDLDQLHRPSIPQPGIELASSGANLAAVLDVMQNSPDRSGFEALQRELHEAIPTLRGIVLPPAPQQGGAKALEFILSTNGQPPVTIPGSLTSGGALLLTAFLTLAYSSTPGLLLFEEPENGLHPFRLQMVLEILRKMSRGEVGNRKRQIVLTTHNPLLLNYARPEEVRVFVRHPEQGTQVIPMTKVPDINRLLKEFALGELWYLLGEEKLFKEQPA
jgi:predicted ATPase